MKHFINTLAIATVCALAMGTTIAQSASAQPTYGAKGLEGSYVGAGVSGTVTNGGQVNEERNFGGNVQGRLSVSKQIPVSLRGTVYFNGSNSAIVPTLTYDMPVAPNTNVYAGAGYSFVQNDGVNSPIGNKDAAVLNLGVESEVAKGVVVYTDAKLGIRGYQSNAASVGLGAGVAIKF